MVGDKFRFRFRKSGVLRLLSHHDLMRCFERMLRRAQIPFRSTGGFHPTPRLVFALSLPLGIEGQREVVELETLKEFSPDEVLNRLVAQSPEGLTFTECRVVPLKASAVPRRAVYAVTVIPDELSVAQEHIPELLGTDKLWVDRIRPKPRRLNIRPYIRDLELQGDQLKMDFWVTQNGTAKAEELLQLLNLRSTLATGQLLQRIDLEIEDEAPADAPDGPPTGPPELANLTHVLEVVENEPTNGHESQSWGLSPNGPVVE